MTIKYAYQRTQVGDTVGFLNPDRTVALHTVTAKQDGWLHLENGKRLLGCDVVTIVKPGA